MIAFKVSAPGKVILFGEHAVVYGKTAIAGSLDLHTTLEFIELPETEDVVICCIQMNFLLAVPLQKIQRFILTNNIAEIIENELFYDKIKEFASTFTCENLQQKLSLQAFFYSLLYVAQKEEINIKPFKITLDTELAIGAGLGSSASFTVCLAASFLHWSHLQKNICKEFDTSNLEAISKYAYNCERIMHGNPSGIDNTICAYGSLLEFRKGDSIKLINGIPPIRILLVDTRVSRSTKALMEIMLELKTKYPVIVDLIMDTIGNVSKEAIKVIQELRNVQHDAGGCFSEQYKQLMTLINLNQGLLATCQVSHPSLDRICTVAKSYSLAAKLTGAGGGGHAFILLAPDTVSETIDNISKELTADGFTVKLTYLGGAGVQIHPCS